MKSNLGKLDRILRFLLAFWWLGPWAPVFNWNGLNWLIFIFGWIALIESLLGWCWVHQLLKVNLKNQ